MKFTEWIKKYLGKEVDYDGAYGVQCVDLAKSYIKNVLDVTPQAIGNAKEYWNKRKTSKYLKDNFSFITPTYKSGELQAGDIGVRTSGTYGHIFIIAETTKDGKIKYYDTNGLGKHDAMALRTKTYSEKYINGVLRPKNQKNIDLVTRTATTTKKSTVKTTNDYKVTVTANALNVRASATTKAKINDVIYKNEVYTIVEEKDGWGKLKSGTGWISLKYTKKI